MKLKFSCLLFIVWVHALLLPNEAYRFFAARRLCQRRWMSNEPKLNFKIFDNFYDPKPNAPIVKEMNKASGYADLRVYINEMATMQAHKDLIGICMKQMEGQGEQGSMKAPFRPSMTKEDLYSLLGKDKVQQLYFNLLQGPIQMECKQAKLPLVGTIQLLSFESEATSSFFNPGKPHILEVRCDLWPEIHYLSPSEYKGLQITVYKSPEDLAKQEKVKLNIRERYKQLLPTPIDYSAQLGDVLTVNMLGYHVNEQGGKGELLPNFASGNNIEIALESGKFLEGMIEPLVGMKVSEQKTIPITFPTRVKGPGASLSGQAVLFDVEILQIQQKRLPDWNEQLANQIRPGMTLQELEREVQQAIEGDSLSTMEALRNDAIVNTLLAQVRIDQLPPSLVEETAQLRFREVLLDFQQQGSNLEELTSPEKQSEAYQKFKQISAASIEKLVKLGIIFNDITEKEKITISAEEIETQIEIYKSQQKQMTSNQTSTTANRMNKGNPELEDQQLREEIVNRLLKKKVFDRIASYAHIHYVDRPAPETAAASSASTAAST